MWIHSFLYTTQEVKSKKGSWSSVKTFSQAHHVIVVNTVSESAVAIIQCSDVFNQGSWHGRERAINECSLHRFSPSMHQVQHEEQAGGCEHKKAH